MPGRDKDSPRTQLPSDDVTEKARGPDRDLRGQTESHQTRRNRSRWMKGVIGAALVESVETGK
ncbi:mCG146970 [Mus musculus]|nr:mCG146970 [Mus musculus]